MVEPGKASISADTEEIETALKNLEQLAQSFSAQLTNGLKSAVVSGKDLEDVLRRIGMNLAGMALEQGLKPLQGLMGTMFSGLLKGGSSPAPAAGIEQMLKPLQAIAGVVAPGFLGSIFKFAKGGVLPFANGGVVSSPTYFPARGALGLMGEAGPEAILPLQRGADGRLGVAAGGQGGGVSVVFNVTTPDAASFRKSEAQVTGMLARAVSRGSRFS